MNLNCRWCKFGIQRSNSDSIFCRLNSKFTVKIVCFQFGDQISFFPPKSSEQKITSKEFTDFLFRLKKLRINSKICVLINGKGFNPSIDLFASLNCMRFKQCTEIKCCIYNSSTIRLELQTINRLLILISSTISTRQYNDTSQFQYEQLEVEQV